MSRYWLNGTEIGIHPSGYSPVRFDVTDLVKPGENSLVVSLDPNIQEGWWYDGGGIYRHVQMVIVSDVHVAPDSVFVRSTIPDCRDGVTAPADLNVALSVENTRSKPASSAEVRSEVLDSAGNVVVQALKQQDLAEGGNEVEFALHLPEAKLWSCEHPELYTLRTTVSADGKVLDSVTTNFGVRKIAFDEDRGFLLNDREVKIEGACIHQNHAGVGVAIPDRLHEWRLEQLKEMGCNAIRTVHYKGKVVYDACDRLGILVMDEFRQFGDTYVGKSSRKTSVDSLRDQIDQVKRVRNHPSIFLWCLGNEEGELQDNPDGARIASAMKAMVDTYDGTRLVTVASVHGFSPEGICGAIDVIGINYNVPSFDKIRETFPDKPFIGTESSSEVSTRGFYDRTRFKNSLGGPDLFGDEQRGYLSNYSENGPGWAQSCEVNWKAVAERPWMAGTFIWTGFDYKGEPTPFGQPNQPSISSSFGVMDTCGFPKDNYWYYKSWWTDEPVIHVFPHWNWADKEGETIPVWVHSNAEEVELFRNGKSLGSKTMEPNSHLEWEVPDSPGRLEARGLKDGKKITAAVETTGKAAGLALAPDRTALAADGSDLAWVGVSVVDDKGRVVPTADNMVRFSVSGPGRILGVGNGDSSSHEPDKADQRSAFHGLCMVLVQTTGEPGNIQLKAEADGLKPIVVSMTAK